MKKESDNLNDIIESLDISELPEITQDSSDEDVQNFVKKLLDQVDVSKNNLDSIYQQSGMYAELYDNTNHKKFTSHEHELFITVTFEVISHDHQQKEAIKPEVIKKNYYIPISGNKNYKEFVEAFDKNFHQAIENTCKKTTK